MRAHIIRREGPSARLGPVLPESYRIGAMHPFFARGLTVHSKASEGGNIIDTRKDGAPAPRWWGIHQTGRAYLDADAPWVTHAVGL